MKTSWYIRACLAGNSVYVVTLEKGRNRPVKLYIGKSRRMAMEAVKEAREHARHFEIELQQEDVDLPEKEIYE